MELSKKERLYNAILEAVRNNCDGCDVGTVRAALSELEAEIAMKARIKSAEEVVALMQKKEPRE